MKIFLSVLVALIMVGCATMNMLPESPSNVDFSSTGFVKGEGWHDGAVYEASIDDVKSSIVAALKVNGLTIKDYNPEEKNAIYAHLPPNLYRWSSYVGIYYKQLDNEKVEVHVLVLGTKDINGLADDSETALSPRIIASIGSSLSRLKK